MVYERLEQYVKADGSVDFRSPCVHKNRTLYRRFQLMERTAREGMTNVFAPEAVSFSRTVRTPTEHYAPRARLAFGLGLALFQVAEECCLGDVVLLHQHFHRGPTRPLGPERRGLPCRELEVPWPGAGAGGCGAQALAWLWRRRLPWCSITVMRCLAVILSLPCRCAL